MKGNDHEGRRRWSVQTNAGPYARSKHLKGLVRVALVVMTYRLWPEGSFPGTSTYLGRSY